MLMLTPIDKETKIEADVTGQLDKIEVTPEMIDVGVLRLYDYDPRFGNEEDIVEDIFRKMFAVRRTP